MDQSRDQSGGGSWSRSPWIHQVDQTRRARSGLTCSQSEGQQNPEDHTYSQLRGHPGPASARTPIRSRFWVSKVRGTGGGASAEPWGGDAPRCHAPGRRERRMLEVSPPARSACPSVGPTAEVTFSSQRRKSPKFKKVRSFFLPLFFFFDLSSLFFFLSFLLLTFSSVKNTDRHAHRLQIGPRRAHGSRPPADRQLFWPIKGQRGGTSGSNN